MSAELTQKFNICSFYLRTHFEDHCSHLSYLGKSYSKIHQDITKNFRKLGYNRKLFETVKLFKYTMCP